MMKKTISKSNLVIRFFEDTMDKNPKTKSVNFAGVNHQVSKEVVFGVATRMASLCSYKLKDISTVETTVLAA